MIYLDSHLKILKETSKQERRPVGGPSLVIIQEMVVVWTRVVAGATVRNGWILDKICIQID